MMSHHKQTATPSVPAMILAGGRSLRMGKDKAGTLLAGKPLLHHVFARIARQADPVWVNANAALSVAASSDMALVPDTLPGHPGPLAGVLTALRHGSATLPGASHVATVTIDTPFLPLDLIARLCGGLISPGTIAVASSGGALHPIAALWPVSVADNLQQFIETDDKRRVRAFIERHPHVVVDFELAAGGIDPFFNINTPQDLAQAERWLAEGDSP